MSKTFSISIEEARPNKQHEGHHLLYCSSGATLYLTIKPDRLPEKPKNNYIPHDDFLIISSELFTKQRLLQARKRTKRTATTINAVNAAVSNNKQPQLFFVTQPWSLPSDSADQPPFLFLLPIQPIVPVPTVLFRFPKIKKMAENQPMYSYWDQQAQVASGGPSQQHSQQSNNASLHQQEQSSSSSGQEQRFSLDSVDYGASQSGASASGFASGMAQQFRNNGHPNDSTGQKNQESVRQLQQNLMLMLQQQSELSAASGDQASIGNSSQRSQHSGQQEYTGSARHPTSPTHTCICA